MRLQLEKSTGLLCYWLRLKRVRMQSKVAAAPWTSLQRPSQVVPSHAGTPGMQAALACRRVGMPTGSSSGQSGLMTEQHVGHHVDRIHGWAAADTWRLSQAMPMFKELPPEASAALVEVADWLSGHIVDDSTTESMVSSPTHSAGSRGSWEAPLPPAGQIVQGAPRQHCLPTLFHPRTAVGDWDWDRAFGIEMSL